MALHFEAAVLYSRSKGSILTAAIFTPYRGAVWGWSCLSWCSDSTSIKSVPTIAKSDKKSFAFQGFFLKKLSPGNSLFLGLETSVLALIQKQINLKYSAEDNLERAPRVSSMFSKDLWNPFLKRFWCGINPTENDSNWNLSKQLKISSTELFFWKSSMFLK